MDKNIWNKEDFLMCGLGEKSKILANLKHLRMCIKWSWQRIIRGYADCDKIQMFEYMQYLIIGMLQDLRESRWGSPGYLGENFINEKGILVNKTCHEEWNKILDHMIFLWRELGEDTCTRKNLYEAEYLKAYEVFVEKYGFGGEKLRTDEELEKDRKMGCRTLHFMRELPEYKDIYDKYYEEERKIEEYRMKCKDEAIDLLKEYFFDLQM
jgi:hypothetical protein